MNNKTLSKSRKNIEPAIWHTWISQVCLLILTIALTIGIAATYSAREHFFYYFDWGGFQAVALDIAQLFFASPHDTLILIRDSISLEYNYFFTLPLIPLIRILGDNRLGYILSLGIAYQLPYILIFGALATRFVASHKRLFFWFAVLIALINPIAWAPVLRGYPDIGGACLLLLALYVFSYDFELNAWWQMFAIGVLTALSIIFRRHFAYGVIAFYLALIFQVGWIYIQKIRQSESKPWLDLLKIVCRLFLMAGTFLLTLWLLARPLVERVFTINYTELYASYIEAPFTVFNFFVTQYGWATWFLVGLGFILGITCQMIEQRIMAFALLFGSLSLCIWVFFARQVGFHYTLHATFFVLSGLFILLVAIFNFLNAHKKAQISVLTFYFVALLAIMSAALFPRNPFFARFQSLLPYNQAPFVRSDYDTIVHLIAYLRATTSADTAIYVADSSYLMNFDLLQKAEKELYGWEQAKLNVLVTPQIDSRDYYPLEMLLQAEYVIVTTPYQFHMSHPDEQDVVRVVVDAFNQQWAISKDFVEMPEQFGLEHGAILRVYQRTRPTSWQVAVSTFNAMHEQIGMRPGSQPDWITLTPTSSQVTQTEGFYHFYLDPDSHDNSIESTFLYADIIPEKGQIVGRIDFAEDICEGVMLEAKTTDAAGVIENVSSISLLPQQSGFELAFQKNEAVNLLLFVKPVHKGPDVDQCIGTLYWKLAERDP